MCFCKKKMVNIKKYQAGILMWYCTLPPGYRMILSKNLGEMYRHYDVTYNIRSRATIDQLLDSYHKLVPYGGWHEQNWSGIFLKNNRGISLLLQSYDLISILIRKIYLRSHGNFFICFHDFQQQWTIIKYYRENSYKAKKH